MTHTVDDVRAARDRAAAGGDPARWPDKMPVRDRLAVLFDPGSFVEADCWRARPVARYPPTGW